MSVGENQSLLWMDQIQTSQDLIYARSGITPVWLCLIHTKASSQLCKSSDDRTTDQTTHDLCHLAIIAVETTTRYMIWFLAISHPVIRTFSENVHISRPPELEVRHEIVVEE